MMSIPDRLLRLQGASNFRDLGGYPGHGGRPLRWRRIFRSDHLAGLTASDRVSLSYLGLAHALDFRGVEESAQTPYQLPGVTRHTLSIEPTVVQRLQARIDGGQALDAAIVSDLMADLYRRLVDAEAPRFAALFMHLLRTDVPLVFHCTAGKDRTGLAAALLLLALGTPRDVVMQDYLLTNQHYRHPPQPQSSLPADALRVLWGVQPAFLEAALAEIDSRQGGLPNYLQQRLGLDRAALAALAERYLQAD